MKRFAKHIISAGCAVLLAASLSCVCQAAESAGCFKVYDNGRSNPKKTLTFSDGRQLADLFDDYDDEDYDIYVELYKDLNLGGTGGEPLLIETDADVAFNFKGHSIYRSFPDKSKYYDDGNVLEISPGEDDAKYVFYSDEASDRTRNNPTAQKGTITGGQNDDCGGGIYFDDGGNVYFDNISISGNRAEEGGAFYTNDTDLTVYLENNVLISDNYATERGGAITLYWGDLVIKNDTVVISKNEGSYYGGAIYVYGGFYDAGLDMRGGIITDNTVCNSTSSQFSRGYAMGGGIYVDGDVTITGGEISHNQCVNKYPYNFGSGGIQGGGLYLNGDNNRISNCLITANSASNEGYGGGIYFNGDDKLILNNCTVSDNIAGNGGGLYLTDTADITGCKISGNYANYYGCGGGGVFTNHTVHFTDTEITGNVCKSQSGGGIYALADIYVKRCVISDNKAGIGGGVYVDSEYDFHAQEWCQIIRNFNNDSKNSNLYLNQGRYTTAYLCIDELSDFVSTMIYVTSEDDDATKSITKNSDILADDNKEYELLECIWYDEANWDIDSTGKYLYASEGCRFPCTVHFMREVTDSTDGTVRVHEESSAVYPMFSTIFKGTLWGISISNVSYDTVYTDNPVNASEKVKTAVNVSDAPLDGSPVTGLYYKNVHNTSQGKLYNADNKIRIDRDFVITDDIYVMLRCREEIFYYGVDIPEIIIGEALPTTAYLTMINGTDLSAEDARIPYRIDWNTENKIAQPYTEYSATVAMKSEFVNSEIGGFRYFKTFHAGDNGCTLTVGGKKITDMSSRSILLTEYVNFAVTTDKVALSEVEWPDCLKSEADAYVGDTVPEASLPTSISVAYTYTDSDGNDVTEKTLADVSIIYSDEILENRSERVLENLINNLEFFAEEWEGYEYICTVTLPDFIDASEYASLNDLDYITVNEADNTVGYICRVDVTNPEGSAHTTGELPMIQMDIDSHPDEGTLDCELSVPGQPDVSYSMRTYEVGTDAGAFKSTDETGFTLVIDSDTIAEAEENHRNCSVMFMVEAQAYPKAQGFEVSPVSQLCRWCVEVTYECETYTVTVLNVSADGQIADAEKYSYYPDETVVLTAIPAEGGVPVENMKFLSWTSDDISIDADAANAETLDFVMPERDVTVTAVYAPMVTEITLSLDDDDAEETEATLIFSDNTVQNVTVDVTRNNENGMNFAEVTLAEDSEDEIYFSEDMYVGINSAEQSSYITYDEEMVGTLVAEYVFTRLKDDAQYVNPEPRDVLFDGREKKLLNDGISTGGTIMYALGDADSAPELYSDEFIDKYGKDGPADGEECDENIEVYSGNYSASVPKASEAGDYYVWYLVMDRHENSSSEPCLLRASIAKADQTKPEAAKAASTGVYSITLEEQSGIGTTLYGYTESQAASADDITNWQESPVFRALNEGSDYYFFVKFAGDDNHNEAVTDAGSLISTASAPIPQYDDDDETADETAENVSVNDADTAKDTDTKATDDNNLKDERNADTVSDGLRNSAFVDVNIGDWYYDSVMWAVENEITFGIDGEHFAPDAETTRAQFVTFLWRYAGCPTVNYALPFTDVEPDSWYTEAVRWAAALGITKGTSENTFSPDASITREQLATMLFNYAVTKGDSFFAPSAVLNDFNDSSFISGWAKEAMNWSVTKGIINGIGSGLLAPKKTASRAEIVTMLYRFSMQYR